MKAKANLSNRMQAVFDMIEPCKVAADIGCDHGFVSIAIADSSKAERVIACDINEGPLESAVLNINKAGLSDRIETRLSDGLHKINESDNVETIVVAGMGGALMVKILSESESIVRNAKQLVLQPQSELFLVRQYVRTIGFHIEKEVFLVDSEKYYWVMDIRPGETKVSDDNYLEIYDLYSKYLIDKKDSLLKEYLAKSIETNEKYLEKIVPEKQKELKLKIEKLQLALKLIGE